MTLFLILNQIVVFIGFLACVVYLFSMNAYLQSRKKDNGHFDSGFAKTQDGHRLLSDVVRDDPRWDKK